ncbi:MAG: hypothetical protein GXP29_09890 [Planctomycetes bacterium]|nr:hypothetical protein [Planctomycetota bacterium]
MEPIKTVSTTERIVRNGIVTAMVVGFSVWSFYDGYVAYPIDNLNQAKEELPSDSQEQAVINEKVTEDIAQSFKKGDKVKAMIEAFGPPAWKGDQNDRMKKSVWFGRGGSLVVVANSSGIARRAEWKKGKHRESDLRLQKLMGLVLAPLGLFMLIRMVAMLSRGAEFSDEGLKPSGKTMIPFAAMTGWDTEHYDDRGQITLEYESNGSTEIYLLDDYKLAAFKTIVNEISARKGFENPLQVSETEEVADSA